MQSASGVKSPSVPFRCRRDDVAALPLLYRQAAAELIEKGELVLIDEVMV